MEINKKDLKKISRSFRSIASRVITAHFQEVNSILKMFLEHIDKEKLIINYINSFKIDTLNIEEKIKSAKENYRQPIDTGSSKEEEIFTTYSLLKHIVEKDISIIDISIPYSDSSKFDDKVKGFANRVIRPFVNYIEDYLTEISIDMGFDEDTNYVITVHGGQFNLAKDNSTINANQNNNIDIEKLNSLITNIFEKAKDLPDLDKEVINDNLEIIKSELISPKPKKGFLRTAITGLKTVKATTEFSSAVVTLVQFIQSHI